MTLSQFRNLKIIKFISNKYLLILILFILWMVFFDESSYKTHRDLNNEKAKIEKSIQYFQNEIDKDKSILKQLKDSTLLEKYGRENYFFKRDSEEIYIIEFDTIKK
ncbi:MAG: septum formation initiator [Flavobacteriales bacterium CG03_land_8_20_14_0_80_35_15]|nr:septum formation initiator [Zetaproteobacteria bacterium]NDK19089.1 septum formation initiator [Flavobacteriales bacterium]PIR14638.1 MAG: septum formation initiator [Flavobacteriales bacterium CG11_big_fil_rev_8_21_14_0_20_35_7]PIV16169.1 MAG: septum formation initiator [Flavobacteriales bacterium CG03_land_8_20_14_0_80_35_15]PIX06118.1 MAG: septum formation initiator [Flavobacteriales bacterium CG_4_8_14_3_um_filter_35_10]PJA07083.1 MAG: septum formation initiator [Flavobacteriales bacter